VTADSRRATAIYARVSTGSQVVGQQLDRLRAVVAGAVEYVDDGVSGRAGSRPAFDRLRVSIRAGEISAVYAVKLDRLGRSAKSILEFFELAESREVRVVLVDQQIDTSTPVGRLVRTVLAAMAELEADLAAERTQDTMDAFKSGARTPKAPVGRPRRVTPELADRCDVLRRQKFTWAEIARRTGLKAETCRRAVWQLRKRVLWTGRELPARSLPATGSVENGDAPKVDRAPSGAEEGRGKL
jgi:DNA invertase Pin-like site-specific DNA recombinase